MIETDQIPVASWREEQELCRSFDPLYDEQMTGSKGLWLLTAPRLPTEWSVEPAQDAYSKFLDAEFFAEPFVFSGFTKRRHNRFYTLLRVVRDLLLARDLRNTRSARTHATESWAPAQWERPLAREATNTEIASLIVRHEGAAAALFFLADKGAASITELSAAVELGMDDCVRVLSLLHSSGLVDLDGPTLRLTSRGSAVARRLADVSAGAM